MIDLLINALGLVLVVAIIWWFWLSQPEAKRVENQLVEILVEDGVYTPPRIKISANQNVTLRFLRKDASPCAEKVIFERLDKSLELSLGQPTELTLSIPEAGEYAFTCDMQMYRGTLVVMPK